MLLLLLVMAVVVVVVVVVGKCCWPTAAEQLRERVPDASSPTHPQQRSVRPGEAGELLVCSHRSRMTSARERERGEKGREG